MPVGSCYLYSIPLKNIENWEKISRTGPVHYPCRLAWMSSAANIAMISELGNHSAGIETKWQIVGQRRKIG